MGAVRRLDGKDPGHRAEQGQWKHRLPFSRSRSSSCHGPGGPRNFGAISRADRRTAARHSPWHRRRRARQRRSCRTAALPVDQTAAAHRRSTIRNRVSRFGRGSFRVHVRLNHDVASSQGDSPMDPISDHINRHRRLFFGAAAATVAAAQLGMIGAAAAQPGATKATRLPAVKPGTNTSFGAIRQIDAGVLNVGYAEAGPSDGAPVILLHGWPYDIYSYVDVAPLLASAGYHVIVPYLRGYGTTRFLSGETPRNGQQAALAVDTVALMDALRIEQATLAGYDWGARTADIVAALWPERVRALVSVSAYLIGSQEINKAPLPPKAELAWWYQFYFTTERGRAGYDKYRHDFARLIWQLASPQWAFDEATFARSAAAFDNPDHVDITIHNYRWRLGLADGERQYDALEQQLAQTPVITVPAITLEGDANGAPHADSSVYAQRFTGKYAHRNLTG